MFDTQSDPIRSDVIVLFWGGGGWAGAQQKVGTITEPSSESRLEFISSSLTLQFTRSQTERGATQQTTLQRRFHEEGGEKKPELGHQIILLTAKGEILSNNADDKSAGETDCRT